MYLTQIRLKVTRFFLVAIGLSIHFIVIGLCAFFNSNDRLIDFVVFIFTFCGKNNDEVSSFIFRYSYSCN